MGGEACNEPDDIEVCPTTATVQGREAPSATSPSEYQEEPEPYATTATARNGKNSKKKMSMHSLTNPGSRQRMALKPQRLLRDTYSTPNQIRERKRKKINQKPNMLKLTTDKKKQVTE